METEKKGLQPLIDALRRGIGSQRDEALGALRLLSGEDHGDDPDAWQRWWDRSRSEFMGEARPSSAPPPPAATPAAAPPGGPDAGLAGIPDPDLIPRPSGRIPGATGAARARGGNGSGVPIWMVGLVLVGVVFGYIYYKLHSLGVLEKLQGLPR